METAARTNPASLQLNPQVILAWLRNQLAEVQAQWNTLPATLHNVLGQARTQLRTALDVPSREELATLTTRLSELDTKLAALASRPIVEVVTPIVVEEAAPAPASSKSGNHEKRHRKQ